VPGWTWDPVATWWEEGFRRLVDYVERHGDARVPFSYVVDDGYKLGVWVDTQRQNRAKGKVDADRQRRLQDLPGWTWNTAVDAWENAFGQLLNYVERHGHARVPRSYTVDGYRLGHWVNNQRHKRTIGTLDADRQRRLEDVPGWTWDPFADQWEEGFSRLLDYVKRNGNARVPTSYTIEGYKLGVWVQTQRRKHSKGTLDADRIRRLEELPGWIWDASADRARRRTPTNATVTLASRSPTWSTATSSDGGSQGNA
jgi:Helicase associated domain